MVVRETAVGTRRRRKNEFGGLKKKGGPARENQRRCGRLKN